MSLKIFNQQEKPVEEKTLEVVASEEAKLDALLSYFSATEIPDSWWSYSVILDKYKEGLKEHAISPSIISKVCKKIDPAELEEPKKGYFGLFLTALIQNSYDQGNNEFEFEEIRCNYFGRGLSGKEERKLVTKIGKIESSHCFWNAANCQLTIGEADGEWNFDSIEKSQLFIRMLKGELSFMGAKECQIWIKNYNGEKFGRASYKCEIYSPSEIVLEILQKQMIQNTFEVKK